MLGSCPRARGPALRRRAAPFGRFHRCECGQAIYVVVLFFFLLAGLLFLILNSGEKLNHKVQMQSAADAVAAGGAAWYARGLNVIAMCNVAETQLLSLIVLLDTLETVTPPAAKCIDDLLQNLGSSKAGHDIPIDTRISDWLAVGNAASERQVILKLNDIVAAVNWPDYLRYDNGVLWECTKLMDGFMHAMREVTPLAAQREAIDIADENGAEFGFLLPLWPALPVRDGTFSDFENPMRVGRMPPPDDRKVIGGFAHVMNYRGYYPDYYYRGEIRHGQGPVMGPWSYWREPFTATRPMGMLDISRFSVLFNMVSSKKLEMLFGETDAQVSLEHWEMEYDKAKGLSDEQVLRAWWDQVSFDCRYEFPTAAFFSTIDLRHPHMPVIRTRAYTNMNNPRLTLYTRSVQAWEGADPRQAAFYRVTERKSAHYPQLGIFAPHPPIRPDGSDWPYAESEKQIYYHVSMWRFNGVELELDESLHRQYLPPSSGAPLAPIMFDRTTGQHTQQNVDNYFTLTGFAYRSGKVRHWAREEGEQTGFRNPNPIDDLVAYAQARVYCRYSWDLFTQHWKVKLMRMDPDLWMGLRNQFNRSIPGEGAELNSVLTEERLEPVITMLEAYTNREFIEEFTH